MQINGIPDHLSKEPDVPDRLFGLTDPAQFMKLLEEKGV